MIDIVSDLAKKKNEVISLHEVITLLQEQSEGASLPEIAEWLITLLVNDNAAPSMGILKVGGEFENIPLNWGQSTQDEHPTLYKLLLDVYNNYGVWPGDVPF